MISACFRDVWRDPLGSVVGIAGPDRGAPALLFDGHMDVVPAIGSWTVDPFQPLVCGQQAVRPRLDGHEGWAGRGDHRGSRRRGGRRLAPAGGGVRHRSGGDGRGRCPGPGARRHPPGGGGHLRAVRARRPGRPARPGRAAGHRHRLPGPCRLPGTGKNPITLAASGLAALERLALPTDPDLGPAILVPTDVISQPWPSISLIPSAGADQVRPQNPGRRDPPGSSRRHRRRACRSRRPGLRRLDHGGSASRYTGIAVDAPRWLPAWRTDPAIGCLRRPATPSGASPARRGPASMTFAPTAPSPQGSGACPRSGSGPDVAADAHTPDESVSIEQLRQAEKIYEHLAIDAARRQADASHDG